VVSTKSRKVEMQASFEERLSLARLRRRLPDPAVRKLIRESAGVAQQGIADDLGCSREEVSRWESGERNPGARLLPAYLRILDRLAAELTRPDGEEPQPIVSRDTAADTIERPNVRKPRLTKAPPDV
jgi:transcriptional regulator with XRE-family HTH domain